MAEETSMWQSKALFYRFSNHKLTVKLPHSLLDSAGQSVNWQQICVHRLLCAGRVGGWRITTVNNKQGWL